MAGLLTAGSATWTPGYRADLLAVRPVEQQARAARSALPRLAAAARAGRLWVPPIGIPAAPFGLAETHWMYEGCTFDYGDGAAPYRMAGNGPYTHYVDNTHPAATDEDNAFGTAARPRKTIPAALPAGSVVEIHGGPYGPEEIILLAEGTASAPVFVRGVGKPRIAGKLTVQSSRGVESRYMIVEGLDVFKFWVVAPASYLCYRHNDIHGDATNGGIGIDSYDKAHSNHRLVFYKNLIHDNGNWQADHDQDVHGITVARRTHHVWIVDNEFYHNSGDGVQINAGSLQLQPYTHHIYVGRNRAHHNKQAGFWTKQAVDVIFSQNAVWGLRPIGAKPSAFGAGMGFQYGPERVWFLYNHIYDCCYGISSGSTSELGFGRSVYCIGNLIHDIHHDPNYPYKPDTAWSNAAISLVDTADRYLLNNTIVNCDAGINVTGPGKAVIVNNVIANITQPQGHHVFVATERAATTSVLADCLLYQGDGPARIRWGTATVYSLPLFQAVTGKGTGCRMGDPRVLNTSSRDSWSRVERPASNHPALSQVNRTFQHLYGLDLSRSRP